MAAIGLLARRERSRAELRWRSNGSHLMQQFESVLDGIANEDDDSQLLRRGSKLGGDSRRVGKRRSHSNCDRRG
jgi:hypothetical protein